MARKDPLLIRISHDAQSNYSRIWLSALASLRAGRYVLVVWFLCMPHVLRIDRTRIEPQKPVLGYLCDIVTQFLTDAFIIIYELSFPISKGRFWGASLLCSRDTFLFTHYVLLDCLLHLIQGIPMCIKCQAASHSY